MLSGSYRRWDVPSVRARLKCDGTRAETRFGLSAKRTSPFKSEGSLFVLLLAAELCASAVVVVMPDTPYSEVECKITGYPLHSPVSPSLPVPCVTVCLQVSIELYNTFYCTSRKLHSTVHGGHSVVFQDSYSVTYLMTVNG